MSERQNNDINREMPPSRKRYLQETGRNIKPVPTAPKETLPPISSVSGKRSKPVGNKDKSRKSKEKQKPDKKIYEKTIAKPIDIQREALKQKTKIARRQEKKNKAEQKARGVKRSKNKRNMMIYYIMFAVVAVSVIVILSTTILFNIETINVVGDSPYEKQTIIDGSGITAGQNLIRLDTNSAENKLLLSMPYIDKVEVKKKLPSTVEIAVTQALPYANVQRNDKYYLVSENGRILENNLSSPKSGYITVFGFNPEPAKVGDFIKVCNEAERNLVFKLLENVKLNSGFNGSEKVNNDEQKQLMFGLIKSAKNSGLKGITTINLSDKYNLSMNYENRIDFKLGTNNDIDTKLLIALSLIEEGKILPEEKGVLLLNSTDKAVFRPIYDVVPPETTPEETKPENPAEETTAEDTEPEEEPAEETTEEDTEPEEEPAEETTEEDTEPEEEPDEDTAEGDDTEEQYAE